MLKKKVILAMSGGVDSSVAAYFLQKKGYEVTGVTFILNPYASAAENIEYAQNASSLLGIKHLVVDLRKNFQREVIDYFVEEYLKGRTPNPCVVCNPKIKFQTLEKVALAEGASYFATGHYARVFDYPEINKYLLAEALDKKKDQSYFLYDLKQHYLTKTIFPLGQKTKDEVREIAKNLGLKAAKRAESQEICFISQKNYRFFLEKVAGAKIKPGPIFDLEGHQLGEHQGIAYYTLGQRKGLGLALGQPYYVVKIDPLQNAIFIGTREDLACREFIVENINFIYAEGVDAENTAEVEVKVRYRASKTKASLHLLDKKKAKVQLKKEQYAVTPGQSAVFYKDNIVLGGGIIS